MGKVLWLIEWAKNGLQSFWLCSSVVLTNLHDIYLENLKLYTI